MKKLSLLLGFILLCQISLVAQQLTLRFPDTTAPVGQVNIPAYLSGQAEITSFELSFRYWNFVATAPIVWNVNPLVADSLTVEYYPGGATDWVKLSWHSSVPVTLSGSTLFDVELYYYGGFTDISWLDYYDSLCAFYGPAGNVIDDSLIHGSLGLISGLEEGSQIPGFAVYPVPATHWIHIDIVPEFEGQPYEIFNSSGLRCISGLLPHNSPFRIDISSFPAGMYLMIYRKESLSLERRFLVVR